MLAQGVAIRKRAQIDKANRSMFLWVAGVSVIVGFAVVISIFLVQKLFFNEKVIMEKESTVRTLNYNNDNISTLEDKIKVLDTNQALMSAKANPDDSAMQVVLDALPSSLNNVAIGSSIQNKIVGPVAGANLEGLQIDSVDTGSEEDMSVVDESADVSTSGSQTIPFQISVSGSEEALKQVLVNFEKSIRVFGISSMHIDKQEGLIQMGIDVQAYYEPGLVVKLKEKTVRQ
jgi:hypothetical protein